jgi:hypothetical protein
MGMGPLLIFDKSFLEMLSPEEVFELSIFFTPVGTPVLIREIIADLRKRPKKNRMPEDLVAALAAKMVQGHGVQPAGYRKLALYNLDGLHVPMSGQVPVDTPAPNIKLSKDGKGILIDSVPEQRMWERWAGQDFSTQDEESAAAWRKGIERINLHAVGRNWKEFTNRHFSSSRNLQELVRQVSNFLDDFTFEIQHLVLSITLNLLRAPIPTRRFTESLFAAGLMPRMRDWAPYSASVTKLYLVYVVGLARGFIGPRPTTFVDLQYLFYAPFCMVFVSADKFHRDIWPAASGVNSFVWGPDLKSELGTRIKETNVLLSPGEEKRIVSPFDLKESIIGDMTRRYLLRPGPMQKRSKEYDEKLLMEVKARLAQFE